MIRFSVPDMTCDACIRAITRAIRREDPAAEVRIDLAAHRVDVTSGRPPASLAGAIEGAGYTIQAPV